MMMTRKTRETATRLQAPILWIDGVGGYLLIDREQATLGQAVAHNAVDIGIVGDIRRQAGSLRRTGEDYLLHPLQATQLNQQAIDRPQLLRHQDVIQFGPRVRLQFTKPNSLSATARLDLLSVGRFQPRVDAVLLLADTCLIGAAAGCHIACPQWNHQLTLVRHQAGWFFRSPVALQVAGELQSSPIAATPGLRLCGDDFSLSLE